MTFKSIENLDKKFNNDEKDVDFDDMKRIAVQNIAKSLELVSETINKMTSSELKRVLKTITYTHLAEEIVQGKKPSELEENEQKLIDNVFHLQENVLGYTQLNSELYNQEKEKSDE